MNRVILIGRLTKEPELRKTQNDISVCTFTIACNRRNEGADFLNIVTWRNLAENCHRYIKKGSQVAVSGAIQTRAYEDKTGAKRTAFEIIADDVQFLDRREDKKDMTEVDEYIPF